MKTLTAFFLLTAAQLIGADAFVTVDGVAMPAARITQAATTTATAPVIYGGLGSAPASEWSGKVVLIDRGETSFAAKVKAVQDAGGVAAIIADNVAGSVPPSFTISPATSTIPAVAVTQATGADIKARVGHAARVGSPEPLPTTGATIPDPAGHAGEAPVSDGTKYVFAKTVIMDPSAVMRSDVVAGKAIDFSVSASGTPPFTFQWIKNGTPVAGATSAAFHIDAAQPSDAGSYVCQVSNEKGTSASGPHVVTVIPAQ